MGGVRNVIEVSNYEFGSDEKVKFGQVNWDDLEIKTGGRVNDESPRDSFITVPYHHDPYSEPSMKDLARSHAMLYVDAAKTYVS
jgi:hypothetical protein